MSVHADRSLVVFGTFVANAEFCAATTSIIVCSIAGPLNVYGTTPCLAVLPKLVTKANCINNV